MSGPCRGKLPDIAHLWWIKTLVQQVFEAEVEGKYSSLVLLCNSTGRVVRP